MTTARWLLAYAALWGLGLALIGAALLGQVLLDRRSRRPGGLPMTQAHTPGAGRSSSPPASPGPLLDRSRARGHGPQH